MENFKFPGKINVIDIVDQPDGSAKITFEADEVFKKGFKEYYGLKRWSQKKFNKFIQQAIEDMNARFREEILYETETAKK